MLEALRVLPLVSPVADESTRRVVREPGVPFQLAQGTNRSEVAALR